MPNDDLVEMGLTKLLLVVDLDGTVCNHKHREHLAHAAMWDEFHDGLEGDEPWPDVQGLISSLRSEMTAYIVALTGRDDRFKERTWRWLMKHDIYVDKLLMRPFGDYRRDHDLKPALLHEAFGVSGREGFKQPVIILEDRDKVVEAWRDLGYRCWQVQPGGY